MDSDCRYDLKGFSEDLGLPLEDIADLYSDLIEELQSEILKIKAAFCIKDLTELYRLNHNIKGISANFRILDIQEETIKISNALKNGEEKDIEFLFNNLFVVSENAIKEITSYFAQKGFTMR